MSSSSLPLFGRAYELKVTLPASSPGSGSTVLTLASSGFEPEGLRITFDIWMVAYQQFWYCDVSIYNLDQSTTQQLVGGLGTVQQQAQAAPQTIQQGMWVTLSAGYQAGQNSSGLPNTTGLYGTIWNGPVFQAIYEREGMTDLKLSLHCILGLDYVSRSFVSTTYNGQLYNQTQILKNIIRDTQYPSLPLQVGTISDNIDDSVLPRAKTVFGSPAKYFTQIGEDNNMQWWVSQKGMNFGDMKEDLEINTADPIVYSPPSLPAVNTAGPPTPAAQGLIVGVPQQTQQGVSFRTLLDPRIIVEKPLMRVKIDNSNLRIQKLYIGQLPGILDQDGTYIVGSAHFIGDSRGNDWYTDIGGWTVVGNSLAQLTATTVAPIGN